MLEKLRSKFARIAKSSDLFVIEKLVLRKLGIWPGNKISIKQVLILELVFLSMAYLPIFNAALKDLLTRNYLKLAQVIPQFLICNLNVSIPLIIWFRIGTFKELLKMLNIKWLIMSNDQFPEWEVIKNQNKLRGNKILFTVLLITHILSLFFGLNTYFNTYLHIVNNFESSEVITLWRVE